MIIGARLESRVSKVSTFLVKKTLIFFSLTLIGLFVGASSVLLPQAVPVGIVGIAGLTLLWTLPDLSSVPERAARLLFYPFVFSVLSVPIYYALVIPGIPLISLKRMIYYSFFIPFVISVCGSTLLRNYIAEVCRDSRVLRFLSVALYAVILVTTITSTSPSTTLTATINMTLGWFVPMVAVTLIIRTPKDVVRIFVLMMSCTFLDWVLGTLEFLLKKPYLLYILPPGMRDQLLAATPGLSSLFVANAGRNGLYRASSIFATSLSWGEAAAMMAPICAHFLAFGKTANMRVLGGLGLACSFASVVESGSRGGYVGFVAAMIVYFMLWAVRRNRTHPESLAGGMVLSLYSMFSAAALGAILFVPKIHTFVLGNSQTQSSNDGRWQEWALAKPRILESPVFGYGPGTSADVINYRGFGSLFPSVDSYIMTVLVDFGIPGFVIFASLMLWAIYSPLKDFIDGRTEVSQPGAAIGCSVLAFTLYRITLSQVENNPLFFILVGLVFVQHRLVVRESESDKATTSKLAVDVGDANPVYRNEKGFMTRLG